MSKINVDVRAAAMKLGVQFSRLATRAAVRRDEASEIALTHDVSEKYEPVMAVVYGVREYRATQTWERSSGISEAHNGLVNAGTFDAAPAIPEDVKRTLHEERMRVVRLSGDERRAALAALAKSARKALTNAVVKAAETVANAK